MKIKALKKYLTKPPLENIIIFLSRWFGTLPLIPRLIPRDYLYSPSAVRKCKRYGVNYILYPNDYQNWLLLFYKTENSSFPLLKHLKTGDHVIDIGGNIGQTAMMMAQKVGKSGKVISFEPYYSTYERFKANLELNAGLAEIVKIENRGLGSSISKVKMFTLCEQNSGGYRVVGNSTEEQNSGEIEVEISTLDEYISKNNISRIDFIKIDVEGYEMNVLKGFSNGLTRFKPTLFIEISNDNLKNQGTSNIEIYELIRNLGYTIYNGKTLEKLAIDEVLDAIDILCIYE